MQDASDFKMMDRKAVESILSHAGEKYVLSCDLFLGRDLRRLSVEFEVQEREAGVSKWSAVVAGEVCVYKYCGVYDRLRLQFVTIGGRNLFWLLADRD